MKEQGWIGRFLASTKGQILRLLRRPSKTVNELAATLNITDNAVRAHLATLERDGLVSQIGELPGVRKPHASYGLTPVAEMFFPKSYGAVLRELLAVLREKLPPEQIEEALRQVGKQLGLAMRPGVPAGDMRARARVGLSILEKIGGVADLQEANGKLIIAGYGCPLDLATAGHPEVCRLAEELLREATGLEVTECCEKGSIPRCRFEVGACS
jgi:predicted ArsR family transcriptional regulator